MKSPIPLYLGIEKHIFFLNEFTDKCLWFIIESTQCWVVLSSLAFDSITSSVFWFLKNTAKQKNKNTKAKQLFVIQKRFLHRFVSTLRVECPGICNTKYSRNGAIKQLHFSIKELRLKESYFSYKISSGLMPKVTRSLLRRIRFKPLALGNS